MRREILGIAMATAMGVSAVGAVTLSKTYEFQTGTTLTIEEETESGLRLDSVRFDLGEKGRGYRPGRPVTAEVTISNFGSEARKIGIVIAVLDDQDRLLGVASGGSRLLPLRPERQMTYTLAFDDVHDELESGTKFKISVEPRS